MAAHYDTSAVSAPFGIIAPGRPMRRDWTPISNTKCTMQITDARNVPDIVFFLLPFDANTDANHTNNRIPNNYAFALPDNYGAVLYWQAEGSVEYELLGAVSNARPSGVFRTGWGQNDHVLRNTCNNHNTNVNVTLGVSLEPIETLQNLNIAKVGVEDRGELAKKIALNLFNFMSSFDDGSSARHGNLVVPKNVFERWILRFEAKYKQDPNFFLKEST